MLILLSTAVAVTGIALIVGSEFTSGAWHEDLVSIGAAIFATGPITVMVWWVTDDLYRGELESLQDVVNSNVTSNLAQTTRKLTQEIRNSVTSIQEDMLVTNTVLHDYRDLGVVRVRKTRADALNDFAQHISDEIQRARHGERARLWFVCTDLKGFLNTETNEFNPQALIRAAAEHESLDLRIMIADPEYTVMRSGDDERDTDIRRGIYALVEQLQEYGVKPSAIRLYAYRPSVFAIATSQYMLLNPYPHAELGHRCMSILVSRTTIAEIDENARDIYSQYIQGHFTRTWEAPSTRQVNGPLPLVSRLSLSKNYSDTAARLSKELAGLPPTTADLIEFSGDTVQQLIVELTGAGTRVRLLLKHPDSVGRAQREKIIWSYQYLKEHTSLQPESLQVKFYRVPATIRGRRLDERLLNVGWYTPDISPDGRVSDWEILGDLNPTITSDPGTSEGRALDEMFTRTFDGLWHAGVPSAELDNYLAKGPRP